MESRALQLDLAPALNLECGLDSALVPIGVHLSSAGVPELEPCAAKDRDYSAVACVKRGPVVCCVEFSHRPEVPARAPLVEPRSLADDAQHFGCLGDRKSVVEGEVVELGSGRT